jgi:tetratricopeptide (TPR) repeat protein
MRPTKNIFLLSLLTFLLVVFSCSTEKNTFINRTYHSTTARYNGYFNATILLDEAMKSYVNSLKEDYYNLIPIYPVPNEEEVVGMYPAIDTAIAKCTKVIQRHSMPSNDQPSKKKAEHNKWIDENWTSVGIANFYRRDYEGAMKSFLYVRKFYKNDPSLYVGELWMARVNIETNHLPEATLNLANLDKALFQEAEAKADKEKKKLAKEKKVAKFPKKIMFDLWKTKAYLELKKNNDKDAITNLETSLKYAKKAYDKARVNYILGQLYERNGNRDAAKKAFSKVLKYNCPYQMEFNARLKRAFNNGDEKTKKQLLKMLRDEKNAEYKDQIYYALAALELNNGRKDIAKQYLTKSAFYSTTNARQKGMSYEKLGNLSFEERNYVSAQKYYDSCVTVMPANYPNGDGIKNKAIKLADLVVAVETAQYEDSIQRVAQLSKEEQEKYVDKVIKKEKEDDAARKKRDAERLIELQKSQAAANNSNSGKWYFTNPKLRATGFDEFKKQWGNRENEDDWRRSEKIVFATDINVNPDDSSATNLLANNPNINQDSLKEANYLSNIPNTPEALSASNERLLSSLYKAGVIYKDQLNEPQLAKAQFDKIMARNILHLYDMSAAFQSYKMSETKNPSEADTYKQYILTRYPNSDYANYLKDPDFFVKRKEMEALAEQEYIAYLDRYNRGVYYPVINKASNVIENERENKFRSKYMLLKALSLGMINEDKSEMKIALDTLITAYPGTPEAKKAQELLLVIKNGVSANVPANFVKESIYKKDENAKVMVMVFLDAKMNSNLAKTRIANFNKEYASRNKLKVNSKIYGTDQSIVLIQEFDNMDDAQTYMRLYKRTKDHLLDLQNAKLIGITQENLVILFQTQKLDEYDMFFEENY